MNKPKTQFNAEANFGIGFTLQSIDITNKKVLRLAKKNKEEINNLDDFVNCFVVNGLEDFDITFELIGNEFNETIQFILTIDWHKLKTLDFDEAEIYLFEIAKKYGLSFAESKIGLVGGLYIY